MLWSMFGETLSHVRPECLVRVLSLARCHHVSLALDQVDPFAGICLLKVKQVRINKEVALKVTFELPVQGAVGWLLR